MIEGFCWNLILDPASDKIKCRKKGNGIPDVGCHSLYASTLDVGFFISIINTKMLCNYLKSFINSTVNFTTNDCKQFIVRIPSNQEYKKCKILFDKAIELKKSVAKGNTTESEIATDLQEIEKEVDALVNQLYSI